MEALDESIKIDIVHPLKTSCVRYLLFHADEPAEEKRQFWCDSLLYQNAVAVPLTWGAAQHFASVAYLI